MGFPRSLLAPVALATACYVARKNRAYDRGRRRAAHAGMPTICVGNLSTGGTGKTPMVALVAHLLGARGRRVAVVSRGYGAPADEASDETRLLAAQLPGVIFAADADRVAAARRAVAAGADLLVLDDGFSHRRLARDLDLVLIDAARPAALLDGRLVPWGDLREPPAALARAHALVLTRVEQAAPEARAALRAFAARVAPGVPVLEAATRVRGLRRLDGREEPPDALRGRRVWAFSGLGHPAAFERTLAALGVQFAAAPARLRDHHRYRPRDLARLAARARALGLSDADVITSEKDAMKLPVPPPPGRNFRVLLVETVLTEGAAILDRLLAEVRARGGRRTPGAEC